MQRVLPNFRAIGISALIATFFLLVPLTGAAQVSRIALVERALDSHFRNLGYALRDTRGSEIVLGQPLNQSNGKNESMSVSCSTSKAWGLQSDKGDKAAVVVAFCKNEEVPKDLLNEAKGSQRKAIAEITSVGAVTAAAYFRPYLPRDIAVSSLTGEYMGVVVSGHGLFVFPLLSLAVPSGRETLFIQLFKPDCSVRAESQLCRGEDELLVALANQLVRELSLH